MKQISLRAAGIALVAFAALGGTAHADTVLNTELGPVAAPGVTTTDVTGTRSTSSADSPRVSEAFAVGEWQQRNVGGDGTVGITTDYARSGNGSIFFSTTDGGSKADMEYYFSAAQDLSSFGGASYDWFRDSSSTNNGIQTASLRLILNTSSGAFSQLVFEPYYQGAPGPVATDAWQTSALGAGSTVWSTNNNLILPPGTAACQSCFASLAEWGAANPGLKVIGFSTGVGSGWAGAFTGAVDNINFTFGNTQSSFNFEVSAIPEPATWAMMIGGFGLVGGAMRRRRTTVRTVAA